MASDSERYSELIARFYRKRRLGRQGAERCVANLRNGFSIRHERHEVVGEFTRLYTGTQADAGYIDVPTSQISSFEPDLTFFLRRIRPPGSGNVETSQPP